MPRCLPSLLWLGLFVCTLPLARPPHALAQEKPGDQMIERYLAQETAKLSARFLEGATTLPEWQARRPQLHQEYLDMLGLWPLPEKTPLHATITGTLEHGDVVIDKLHFQSRPGLYVTGNLYRPKQSTGKLPAILYVCGHSGRGRDGNKTAFQDHGLWFGSHGYVCLIIDTLQLGELPGIHHGTYNRGRWWWQARGYTPAGVECWNGIRALDYLVSRPDVDAARLGVTGISGGGASTFWIAAADERVRCAVPVSGMSDLESYVTHKVINGHCDCMFLVNAYRWEWTTIAALVAPRPLLFCNSDKDTIFPMDGNRRVLERLRKIYGMYGHPERVEEYISHGGHEDRADLRVAAFQWMNRHLRQDSAAVPTPTFTPLPGTALRVFPEDKDLPRDARNATIDETFVPTAAIALPKPSDFANWKAGLLQKLRAASFRSFPERIPSPEASEPIIGKERTAQGPLRYCLVTTEPGIQVPVVTADTRSPDPKLATLVVLNPEDPWDGPLPEWATPFTAGRRAYVVQPRGGQWQPWTQQSPPNYVQRAHALLGLTVDQGRVRDIAATVRCRALDPGVREAKVWRVVGRGQAGVLAAYAALLEPEISEVVVIAPPVSHREGPIFLNVLRLLDIPEALGLLAPRKLTLVNATAAAFDRTAAIYLAAGMADKLERR